MPPPPGPRPPVVMPAPIILPGYNPYYSLPPNTSSVVIAGITYFLINGIHYQAQHQGEKVVYVPVQIPATP